MLYIFSCTELVPYCATKTSRITIFVSTAEAKPSQRDMASYFFRSNDSRDMRGTNPKLKGSWYGPLTLRKHIQYSAFIPRPPGVELPRLALCWLLSYFEGRTTHHISRHATSTANYKGWNAIVRVALLRFPHGRRKRRLSFHFIWIFEVKPLSTLSAISYC